MGHCLNIVQLSLGLTLGLLSLGIQGCGQSFQPFAHDNSPLQPASSLEVELVSGPILVNTTSYTLIFNIISTEQMTSVTCQLDSLAPQFCFAQFVTFDNLVDGEHTIRISVSSASGLTANREIVFLKDSTPPSIDVTSTPPLVTNLDTAPFIFAASDLLFGLDRVECSLDNADFAVCVSPINLTALAVGEHSFRIRAYDNIGNVSEIYSYSWIVDPSVEAEVQ